MRALSLAALAILFLGCSSSDSGSPGGDPDGSLGDAPHDGTGLDGTTLDGVTLDDGPRDTTSGADTTATADTTGKDGAGSDTATSSDTTVTDDAGAMCEKGKACGDGPLSCLCCPAGGPRENCTCSTKCTSDGDCTDPSRPKCNQQAAGVEGFCTTTTFMCCWGCK